jgi:hypothetical protein
MPRSSLSTDPGAPPSENVYPAHELYRRLRRHQREVDGRGRRCRRPSNPVPCPIFVHAGSPAAGAPRSLGPRPMERHGHNLIVATERARASERPGRPRRGAEALRHPSSRPSDNGTSGAAKEASDRS